MSFVRGVAVLTTVAALIAGCSSGESGDSSDAAAQSDGPRLDGTYVLDFDVSKRTALGAPAPETEPVSARWAFRSNCSDAGCVATATRMKSDGTAMNTRVELDLMDGKWVMVFGEDSRCNAGGQPARVLGAWVLEPQPDNSLTGMWTEITTGTDCPWVVQMPVKATRQGDVPDNLEVKDPASLEPRKPSKPEGFQGVYTQTIRTQPDDGQPGILSIDVRTFCVRNTDECASTQATSINNDPQTTPLTFEGNRWTYKWDRSGMPCPDGAPSQGFGYDEVTFPDPAQNPMRRLTGVRRLEVAGPCPGTQVFDLLYELGGPPAPAPPPGPAPAPAPGPAPAPAPEPAPAPPPGG